MNQTRLMSLVEVSTNTAIGYAVSFAAWPVVAALSIARGYIVRRFFETRIHRLAARVAGWWADDDDWRWR